MSEQKTVKELPACPVETTLTLIGDKWKVLILRDLLTGTKRFGELKKSGFPGEINTNCQHNENHDWPPYYPADPLVEMFEG